MHRPQVRRFLPLRIMLWLGVHSCRAAQHSILRHIARWSEGPVRTGRLVGSATVNGANGRGFRPDVEGLRAVAVCLVVAFHAGLAQTAGGFIGVDVFFVLSGFLITRLLLEERFRTGTVSLPTFWSRRARRLLPAACLTLVATVVAAQFVLPPLQRRTVTIDGLFSGVFLANFRFSETLGNYFGNQLAQTHPSPFLHYWSLAVEEQFYVLWPIAVLLATRFGQRPKVTLGIVTASAAIGSFAIGVWWTPQRPEAAFYLLPARMWELLAGALLAIAGPAIAKAASGLRAALGWLGLLGIAVAAMAYSETTPFPGYAALLPVLGTVAILVAGAGQTARYGPHRLLGLGPLQWIGGISYAIYLWHWPVLVLVQAHDPSGAPLHRFAAITLSVALAYLSTRFVENPIRFARFLAASPKRGLGFGLGLTTCTVLFLGIAWITQPSFDTGDVATAVALAPPIPTTIADPNPVSEATDQPPTIPDTTPAPVPNLSRLAGLEAELQRILEDAATTTDVPANLRPSLLDAARDTAQVYFDGCISLFDSSEVLDCRYGSVGSETRIVLFGDSHAAHWFPAAEVIATAHGAELVVIVKGGCPVSEVPSTRVDLAESCPAWRAAAIATVMDLQPAMVIAASLSGYTLDEDQWENGLTEVLDQLNPWTDRLIVMLDTPRPAESPPLCLSENIRSAEACVTSPTNAIQFARAESERAAAATVNAEIIDPTSWLCGQNLCPVIIGNTLLYRDGDHITTVASLMLAPLLDAALFP